MLTEAIKQVTSISDNEDINLSNYFEAINNINTLYRFINKIKMIAPIKEITFLPTFRGRVTCEKYGLAPATDDESSMKIIHVKSEYFLEDGTWKKVNEILGDMISSVVYKKDIIMFKLK